MNREQANAQKLAQGIAFLSLVAWLVKPGNDYVKRVILAIPEHIEKRTERP